MAAIGTADVTYALIAGSQISSPSDPRMSAMFTVTFGGGVTYPSGGVPLSKGKLGCPTAIQEFYIITPAAGDGFVYKYNQTANTIQMYAAPAQTHVHPFIMAGGVTTTADFLYHSSGALGKAAATNVTIAGTAPTSTGGVVGLTQAAQALSEVDTAVTVAATTLRVRVVGF